MLGRQKDLEEKEKKSNEPQDLETKIAKLEKKINREK